VPNQETPLGLRYEFSLALIAQITSRGKILGVSLSEIRLRLVMHSNQGIGVRLPTDFLANRLGLLGQFSAHVCLNDLIHCSGYRCRIGSRQFFCNLDC